MRRIPAVLFVLCVSGWAFGLWQAFEATPWRFQAEKHFRWHDRYQQLHDHLVAVVAADYLNDPERGHGRPRYYRAQNVLAPTALVPAADLEALLAGGFLERPVVLDFRGRDELNGVLRTLLAEARGRGIPLDVERYPRQLALVKRRR